MHRIIQAKLREIEAQEHVRILHCVESGSRAWGFASPGSDYDVRFLYVRRAEDYLRLDKTRDVIEWQLDDVLDINGWDLQKALRLLHKSNSTLFEWNNSPIVYKTTAVWQDIARMCEQFFDEKASLYHYMSMGKSNARNNLCAEQVKLKKYFYVLRSVLACRWIMDRHAPPPVCFHDLVKACLPKALAPEVESLLEIKLHAPEQAYGSRRDVLNDYISRSFADIEDYVNSMPKARPASWERLNSLFLEQVMKAS